MQRVAAIVVALTLLALGWQLATRGPVEPSPEAPPLEPGGVADGRDAPSAPVDDDLGAAVPRAGVTRASHAVESADVLRVPLRRLEAEPPTVAGEGESEGRIVITGRVTDEEGAPVAGVVVRAVQQPRGGASAVTQTRTDALGTYSMTARIRAVARRQRATRRSWQRALGPASSEAELEAQLQLLARVAAHDDDRSGVAFEVSVEDARGLRAEHRFEPSPGESSRRVDLTIRREYPFRGTVVDGSRSVADATVLLFDAERNLLGSTTTDDGGAFVLAAPPAGRFELLARALDHGAAGLGGVSLGPGQRSLEQDVALGGTGVLRGRLRYPTGEPVGGVTLHGVLDGLAARNPELPHFPTPLQLLEEEFGGGLALASATTETDGRFRMEGVQPGSYRLAYDLEATGLDPDGLFRTGPEHGVVLDASRVIVSVIEDGAWRYDVRRSARGTVRVHCVRADWRDLPPGTPSVHQIAVTDHGAASFLVPTGHDWVVFAEHEGQLTHEVSARFRSRPGDGLAQIDLTPDRWISGESLLAALAPPEERARLEIVVRDPSGERLDAELWLLRVEDGELEPVYASRAIGEGKGLGALRAGTYQYRLRVSEAPHDYWVSPRLVPLDLPPGADVTLEVEASPVLVVFATVAPEEGAEHDGAREFVAELLPARGVGEEADPEPERLDAGRALDPFELAGELRLRSEFGLGFGREPLTLGRPSLALVRQPAGAYRLRLTAVDDSAERYEATFQLRDDRQNRLQFVLPGR